MITGVPKLPDTGNCCDDFIMEGTYKEYDGEEKKAYFVGTFAPDELELAGECKREVFQVGEVLILNDYGREIPYPGRKPSKWFVDYELYDDLDVALERARDVFENTTKDGQLPPLKEEPLGWQSGEMRRNESNLLVEMIRQTPKEQLLEKFPGMKPLVDALRKIGEEADERRSGGSEDGQVDAPGGG